MGGEGKLESSLGSDGGDNSQTKVDVGYQETGAGPGLSEGLGTVQREAEEPAEAAWGTRVFLVHSEVFL